MKSRIPLLAAALGALWLAGCAKPRPQSNDATAVSAPVVTPVTVSTSVPDPLQPVAADTSSGSALDHHLARLQAALRQRRGDVAAWEQLGWAFVARSRASFDEQFLVQAEACAGRIEALEPGAPAGRLLLGHVRHSQHRFAEAERLGRDLATERGLQADFGLLGDALMDQGRLAEAAVAYQRMIDLRPDLQSYYRAAHLRWLKGDLEGALEACRLAVRAVNPRDPEPAAWIHTRLAAFQFQAGDFASAQRNCAQALAFQSNYPPALLLEGRLRLAQEDAAGAIGSLERAARQVPLPEYQWALAEALRRAGRTAQAQAVEDQLIRHGAAGDPRGLALFLATRGSQPGLAVQLAQAELRSRADVLTQDALAWALWRAGRVAEADGHMLLALRERTQSARLELHAAAIAASAGRHPEAVRRLTQLQEHLHELLPSEQDEAERIRHRLALDPDPTISSQTAR